MHELKFEWDERKNRMNRRKHGVSFEEAQTTFFDEDAIEFYDPDHSEREERFLLLGRSFKLRILIVCHCYRKAEDVIRIISTRRATRREQLLYIRRENI